MNTTRIATLLLAACCALALLGVFAVNALSGAGSAATAEDKYFQYNNGLGASGYDLVAYFEENRATQGKPEFTAEFAGMQWHFRSAAARDKFVAAPGKYLPAYGGHCAYGVAQNYLVRGDPQAWSIRDGRLYFNYNKNVRNAWLADASGLIAKSEANWPDLNRP